jgi:hypothetical protein
MRTGRWFFMIDSESIRMLKDESVTSFLGRFTRIRDELGAVGEVIDTQLIGEASFAYLHQTVGSIYTGHSCHRGLTHMGEDVG